jgi:NitT/TauT family transport system substrate-binding protein
MDMGRRVNLVFSVCFIAFSLVTSVCLAASLPAVKPAQNIEVKLALNWKAEPQFGGFYAAQAEKLKSKHGVKLDIIQGGSGTPTVQMLSSKQIDFAIVSADEILLARQNGADIIAVFATYQDNPQGLMAHSEKGFKNIYDIFKAEGVVALQKGLPYAQYILKKLGGELRATVVPYSGGIGSFLSDPNFSQQCFVTSEPLTARKAGAKLQTFLVKETGFNPYTTVFATRGEFATKNPELLKKVSSLVKDGWISYLEKSGPTNQIMNKLNPAMDLQTMTASAEAQRPLILPTETESLGSSAARRGSVALGSMTVERWSRLIDQMVEIGLLKKKLNASDVFLLQ